MSTNNAGKTCKLLLCLGLCLTTKYIMADDANSIVATYDGGNVSISDVMKQYKNTLPSGQDFNELSENARTALVNMYINDKLLTNAANNSNTASSKEFESRWKRELPVFRQQVINSVYIANNILKNVADNKNVHEAYDELVKKLKNKKEANVYLIITSNESEARKIKTEVSKSSNKLEEFKKQAKMHSLHDESKVNGGDIGYVVEGQLPLAELNTLIFSGTTKTHEVVGPVSNGNTSYVIAMRGGDMRVAEIPSFKQAEPHLVTQLQNAELTKYITNMREKHKVEIKTPSK